MCGLEKANSLGDKIQVFRENCQILQKFQYQKRQFLTFASQHSCNIFTFGQTNDEPGIGTRQIINSFDQRSGL